jgi:hypothetical protein
MNGFFDGMDDNKGSKQIVDREWVRPGDYLVTLEAHCQAVGQKPGRMKNQNLLFIEMDVDKVLAPSDTVFRLPRNSERHASYRAELNLAADGSQDPAEGSRVGIKPNEGGIKMMLCLSKAYNPQTNRAELDDAGKRDMERLHAHLTATLGGDVSAADANRIFNGDALKLQDGSPYLDASGAQVYGNQSFETSETGELGAPKFNPDGTPVFTPPRGQAALKGIKMVLSVRHKLSKNGAFYTDYTWRRPTASETA